MKGRPTRRTASNWALEPIKVLEVVTFYPGFRQSAPGKYHVRVCRTLSCAMAGSYELMESSSAPRRQGIDRSAVTHHDPIAVSPDGKFSIEFAECLACLRDLGPVCLVNDEFHEKAVSLKQPTGSSSNTSKLFAATTRVLMGDIKYLQGKQSPIPRERRI